jgi:hypothetical protein
LRITRKGQHEPIELTITRAMIRLLGAGADLQVVEKNGRLQIEATGGLPILDFQKGAPVTLTPKSSNEFVVDGGDYTFLAFLLDGAGKPTGLLLNPGPWQVAGQRVN